VSNNGEAVSRDDMSASAERANVLRDEVITEIVRTLKRLPTGRLKGVELLIKSPAGRIFLPRSAHGMSLFNRLQGIDAVFSRCEQQLMRNASSMECFDKKMGLERRMFEINTVLVEVAAEMAIEFHAEDASRDEAIEAKVKSIKAERKQEKEPAKAGRGPKANRDKSVPPAIEEATDATVTTSEVVIPE
jgi:hypothetical protein